MILIRQIKINAAKADRKNIEKVLIQRVSEILKISRSDITAFQIIKESLDARKKPEIFYIYNVAVSLSKEKEKFFLRREAAGRYQLEVYEEPIFAFPQRINEKSASPLIAGSGPAGLFAAYFLAKGGFKPVLIERGSSIEKRKEKVEDFIQNGQLDLSSNIQFGEGGAGTFSDGKLNTGTKDKQGIHQAVLKTFVRHGAPASILYESKPHLGTDRLEKIIVSMRNEIIANGGKVLFDTKLDDLIILDGKLQSVVINESEELSTDHLILAIGHSARDTFRMLHEKNIDICGKPFAVGVRAVHEQKFINVSQYGMDDPYLPAADYKLTMHTADGRSVYSFCMCPGGYVIASASENAQAVVNGMSYSGRNGKYANAAIVVNILPEDLSGDSVFAGMTLQEELEERAFKLGKAAIPIQSGKAFLDNCPEEDEEALLDIARSAVKGKVRIADVREIFPQPLLTALCEGVRLSDRKIRGFSEEIKLIAGVESRTSSPVKILRDDGFESNIKGIYPCGEGAGYAGGIMSAAVDGIKTAYALACKLNED